MRIFAIADPHLSSADPKPMDIFGAGWLGHPDAFFDGWRATVGDDDLVLVPGDISWAMGLDGAAPDLEAIGALPGAKILLRGNHDYWWSSISKVRRALPEGMHALQNDALLERGVLIAGTRGWNCPGSHGFEEHDEKIYRREVDRLGLSLAAARRIEADAEPGTVRMKIAMMHYPPTNPQLEASGFTEALEAWSPDAVVFGHVHGYTPRTVPERMAPPIGEAELHFVAADALGFRPRLVAEVDGDGAQRSAALALGSGTAG